MELYSPIDTNKHYYRNTKPLKVAVVTSLRDIVGEDRNGCMVDTSQGKTYMMGLVEALARGISKNIGGMGIALQIVGIIYDDTEVDVSRMSEKKIDLALSPSLTDSWLFPQNLKDAHTGELLINKTHHLPSRWRSLPKGSKARKRAKSEWENQLGHTVFNELNADVLLSDHLMIILENIVLEESGYSGKILNIHPAITDVNDPDSLRGATPTSDAIEKARREGQCFTGSTLHYLTSEIDGGAPIAAAKRTTVFADDNQRELRAKNYPCKIAVAIAGLMHYREYLMRNKEVSVPYADKIQTDYPLWINKLEPVFNKLGNELG